VVLKLVSFRPKGYVLIHTLEDISTPTVLFYSGNKLNKDRLNPVLSNIIDQFVLKYDKFNKVSNLKSNLKSGSSETDPISFENVIEEPINSLLVNYRWHQRYPYNQFLDWYNNGLYKGNPVGCMSIALGEIIAYNKHYSDPSITKVFDWEKMKSTNAPADHYMEINELLEKIFPMVMSNTSSSATSGVFSKAESFMKQIGYNTQVVNMFDYGKAKSELKANRPIYIRGVDKMGNGTGGHAFVCDGHKSVSTYMINNGVKPQSPAFITNYIHLNWGWKESTFHEDFDGWSFVEGLNVTTKKGIHFYNVDNKMLLLKP